MLRYLRSVDSVTSVETGPTPGVGPAAPIVAERTDSGNRERIDSTGGESLADP